MGIRFSLNEDFLDLFGLSNECFVTIFSSAYPISNSAFLVIALSVVLIENPVESHCGVPAIDFVIPGSQTICPVYFIISSSSM